MSWQVVAFDQEIFKAAAHTSEDLQIINNEVLSGVSASLKFKSEHIDINCVIRGEGSELVLVMAVGKGLVKFIKEFASRAVKTNFKTVRFHTKRKGIAKISRLAGFNPVLISSNNEQVYRVVL